MDTIDAHLRPEIKPSGLFGFPAGGAKVVVTDQLQLSLFGDS
ncbi:hypothetical protein [Micromonospora sp. WMMD980]|nr:hypothetical protein [Micromonospora sp. WMMD980]MDG4803578.1 hypothetical protein [Micromonospora sp. WMMD980]